MARFTLRPAKQPGLHKLRNTIPQSHSGEGAELTPGMGRDGLGQMCAFATRAKEEQYICTRPRSGGSKRVQMGWDLSVTPEGGGGVTCTCNLPKEPAFQKQGF